MVKNTVEIYMGRRADHIQDYGLQQQAGGRRDHRFHQEEQMQSAVAHLPCFFNLTQLLCVAYLVAQGIFKSCLCSSF